MTTARQGSLSARLARLGFTDPEQAQALLADPAMAGLQLPTGDDLPGDSLLAAFGDTADPDLALRGLVRLRAALGVAHRSAGRQHG